jgi:hypothetical protein
MEYYGITTREADYLFDPACYSKAGHEITPEDVIEHVHDVLNGHVPAVDFEDDDETFDGPYADDQASPPEGFV